MFGHQFYHQSIRKYVIMFGNLFNDISVSRLDANGNTLQRIAVPIAYGPKQKYLSRITQDPNLDREKAIVLPRIGFEMTSISYAGERKLSSTQRNVRVTTTDGKKLNTQYTPVPYDINFQLSIFSKNADDGAQILEQILPFFTPEWTTTINVIPSMGIKMDIPTVLQNVSMEDTYEGDFETRRAIVHNLDFMVKGYIYGPVSNTGTINRSIVLLHDGLDNNTRTAVVTMQPGLLANGSPTTNVNATVSKDSIFANNDYGFASTLNEYDDGLVFDPTTGDYDD
jgi:hypothetical protein